MREGKEESVTHNMHHDRLQIGQVPPQDRDPSWDLLQLPVLSVSLCLDLDFVLGLEQQGAGRFAVL